MYPNQGDTLVGADLEAWNPTPTKERSEQEKEELLQIASSAKVINDVMDWIDQQIAFYGNLDSIEVLGGTEQSLQLAMNVAKGMQTQFRTKKKEFVTLYHELLKQKELLETQ